MARVIVRRADADSVLEERRANGYKGFVSLDSRTYGREGALKAQKQAASPTSSSRPAPISGPRNEKYVLIDGKYKLNPAYDPPFDITLGQAIAAGPLIGAAAAALTPEAAAALFARRTGLLNSNDYVRLGTGWKQKAGKEIFRMSIRNKGWEPLKGLPPFPWHLP